MLSLRRGAITKLAFIFLLALVACPAFATSYSCAGSGNRDWHTTTDWIPAGIPAAGDTVTITAGCTMQCEANNTCTAGKSGNPGSVDMTIQVDGDFVVESGATVDMRGDVTMSGELDIFGGTFLLDPSGAGSSLYYIDGGSDTGADTLKICSESTCSSNTGALGILQCNKGGSGACQLRHTSHAGNGMNVLGSHGQISNFGNSSTAAILLTDGAYPPTGGFVLKNNFSLHSNGVIQVGYESPALNLTFDGVSFDTLVDVNGSYNGYSFMDLISTATPSGDRTFRVSCANPSSHQGLLNLDVTNITVGDETHPGLVSYNCVLANSSHGGTFQNVLSVVDRNVNSGSALWTAYNSNSLFENWVMYDHTPNQHSIVGLNINGGGTTNTYKGSVFDGDGYAALDYGDDYQDFGTYSASYGLHINSSGTLYTLSATTTQTGSFDHETMYNSYGGALCETGCTATMLKNISNSLFVLPAEFLGAENNGNDGMHVDSRYGYPYRQTALSSATDYNFFWQMPGSGDPGANPAKNAHIQLNLNGIPSWVAMTDPGANLVTNQSATMNGTNVTCTNCFTHAQAKDYIVDTTQTPNQYGVIESVTDPSHATLYFSIQGWNNSHRVDVRPGYFASNGYYGVDWGTHDQHLNPVFQDTTRNVCSWWKHQSDSTAKCAWPNGNNYTATSGTNSTTIVDTSVNFNTLGVQDGVDVVMVYNTGWAPLGSATVVSHTATSLTVSSIPGAASGDPFTFITAPQNLGLAVVQIYGFDINGNQVTPPAWVNENMVPTIQSYVQEGYAPTNPDFFGAGSDGLTVGAVQVPPPAARLTVSKTGSGTVFSSDGHINCGSTCSYLYPRGSVIALTASPDSGYTFTGWSGCDSAHDTSCTLTMLSPRNVSANFVPTGSAYPLTLTTTGGGIGTVKSNDGQINCRPYCVGNYAGGAIVTLTAVAGWQSTFAGWAGCDSYQGNVCTVNVNSARNVTATFDGSFAGLRFVPVEPCRVADTRNPTGPFGGPPISGNTSRSFPLPQGACGIPSTAMAYSLNVTVVPHGPLGYLTVWPTGLPQPFVSLMNSQDGRIKANAAIVPAGDVAHDKAVSVYVTDTTDVVLDINGYFEPAGNGSALAFYPVTPCRVVDTRNSNGPLGGPYISGNTSRDFPVLSSSCNLPNTAQAYSMNFTAVPHGPLGYLTVWPSDQQQPYVSTLNAPSGQNTANAAIVSAAKNGDISVFVTNDSDVVIDINGYFAPVGEGGLSLYPVTPCRALDTRLAAGAFSQELTVSIAGSPCSPPLTAQAYVLNATVVPLAGLGYLSLWPDGQMRPLVSTLNASDGAITSNMAIVPTTNGLIDSYASNLTQLVLDISSYFAQ